MDINSIWNNIDTASPSLERMVKQTQFNQLKSKNVLAQLKKKVLINLCWAILIAVAYLIVIFLYPVWQIVVGFGTILIFSIWGIYATYLEYKKINPDIDIQNNLVQELARHHSSITHWIKTQEKVALFFYPISAASGFLFGGMIGSGKPIEVFLSKPIVWITLIISIIVCTIAAYYLAKWMFKVSFGKTLQQLEDDLDALRKEENTI
ncbi:MAG: hypothetical protein ACOYKE_14770 [Ferruginibacter sp.]